MTSDRERAGVTVTAETLGADADGPDAIVVRVHGEEVGAYAIADDAEAERRAMGRMVDAILAQGRREGAEAMRERAATVCDREVAGWDAIVQRDREDRSRALRAGRVAAEIAEHIRALPTDTSEESGQ